MSDEEPNGKMCISIYIRKRRVDINAVQYFNQSHRPSYCGIGIIHHAVTARSCDSVRGWSSLGRADSWVGGRAINLAGRREAEPLDDTDVDIAQ